MNYILNEQINSLFFVPGKKTKCGQNNWIWKKNIENSQIIFILLKICARKNKSKSR